MPTMHGDAATRTHLAGRFQVGEKGRCTWVIRLGFDRSTATRLRNGTQARIWRSRPVSRGRITCRPGRPIRPFIPLRAKRRRRRPKRSPMSRPSIPSAKSPTRIAVVDVDPKSSSYSKIVGNVATTERRRRAPSFRLERLLLVPVPERAASARRAALPGGPGPALLAHLHPRHQARSARSRRSSR